MPHCWSIFKEARGTPKARPGTGQFVNMHIHPPYSPWQERKPGQS